MSKQINTPAEFVEKWDNINDDRWRLHWLQQEKDFLPKFKIEIDNDWVGVTFPSEEDKEDPITCSFDNFGYELLYEVFKGLSIPVDFV